MYLACNDGEIQQRTRKPFSRKHKSTEINSCLAPELWNSRHVPRVLVVPVTHASNKYWWNESLSLSPIIFSHMNTPYRDEQ